MHSHSQESTHFSVYDHRLVMWFCDIAQTISENRPAVHSELEAVRVIQRDGNGRIRINEGYESLYLFAELLRRQKEREDVEPYVEIIHQKIT